MGLKPFQILLVLENQVQEKLVEAGLDVSAIANLKRREVASLADIQNIVKAQQQRSYMDKNDVMATRKLIQQLKAANCVLYHHEQKLDDDGNIAEHFRVGLACPFGLRMLKAFGQELSFLDAVYGMDKYGYAQLTLLVQDDAGNGVPAAFAIVDTENSEFVLEFLEKVSDVRLFKTHARVYISN